MPRPAASPVRAHAGRILLAALAMVAFTPGATPAQALVLLRGRGRCNFERVAAVRPGRGPMHRHHRPPMPKGQHIDRRVITACLLPLVALLALATAWIDAPAPVASPERAVIEAVLASVDVGVPARVAVAPTTPVMSPEWFPEIGAEGAGPEAALWHQLARVSATGRDAGSLALPSRAWVISPTLATAFDSRDASWLATLARLRLRLSGNAGVVGLSPVALSADGGSALVYYEYRSGARCGHGTVAWLVRMPDGRWRLRERLPIWES